MNHAVAVSVRERTANLTQDTRDSCWRLWTKLLHQSLQIDSVQQLHHVVEDTILCDTEVVQLHGMRGAQRSRRFCLLLEPASYEHSIASRLAKHVRLNQLDGRVASQHVMTSPPHLS